MIAENLLCSAADRHGHICELLLLRLHPGQDPLSSQPLFQAHAAGDVQASLPLANRPHLVYDADHGVDCMKYWGT